MEDKVGVAIIHYGDQDVTERCLSSLLSQIDSSQIAIVANSPVERGHLHNAVILDQPTNEGYGAAVNAAACFARGTGWKKIVITNNDVVFLPGSLSTLFSEIDDNGKQTVVAPLILWGDSDKVWSYGGHINKWRAIGLNGLKARPIPTCEVRNHMPVQTFVSGCCFGAPVDLLMQRPFDTQYFLYYEDAKWCLELQSLPTVKVIVSKEAAIKHYPSSSTGIKTPLYLYYNTRNRMFFARAIGGIQGLIGFSYSVIGVFKNFAVQMIKGNKAGAYAAVRALKDFLRGRNGKVEMVGKS